MLPVIAGESAECVTELSKPVGYCTERPLVFSLEQHIDTLKRQASAWGIGLREVDRYPTIWAVENLPSPPTTILLPANCGRLSNPLIGAA